METHGGGHGWPMEINGDEARATARVEESHWTAVKVVLKYQRRTKDIFLVYSSGELILECYNDASFQSDDDDAKSQLGFVFKLNGGAWFGEVPKQDTAGDSTMEAEYIAALEATTETV
ncbi:hypothetical protein Sango_2295200 [Sesamum angolense]|uniref:Uncharacterized protein n=1 Tax=Sesamum angolense TaxID=2727404 RepID=A0AAE2BLA9_9LAMI|nr:hypothetical protein Sango_2295200 [Sesamum angolense]